MATNINKTISSDVPGTETGTPHQRSVDEITTEILRFKGQTEQSFLEIGGLLCEAKSRLKHGQWLNWLEEKVEVSVSKAQRLMQLHREFSNATPVSHLGFTKAYILMRLPANERDEFISMLHLIGGKEKSVAEMTKRELEMVVREKLRVDVDIPDRETVQEEPPEKEDVDTETPVMSEAERIQLCIDTLHEYLSKIEGAPNEMFSAQINELCERAVQVYASDALA